MGKNKLMNGTYNVFVLQMYHILATLGIYLAAHTFLSKKIFLLHLCHILGLEVHRLRLLQDEIPS